MALTILTGSSQAAATNYSYTTSGSADWASVPTASYFYDITDKTVRFKDTNSTFSNVATASFALTASNVTGTVTSASYAATASLAPLYLPLTGGTISGNVSVLGTASIAFLNVTYESASVIYSSGSNQFGDATNDTQTLIGRTIVSGSLEVTGSANLPNITGSLFGTSSWATNAITASYITSSNVHGPFGANSILSASYAATASYSQNLQISGSINNVDYIDFNKNNIIGTNAPAWKEGRVFYDSGSGALAVYNWEQDVTLNVGQEQWLRARNQTGVTITNGSVVRLLGAIGDRPTVTLAQATDQTNTFSTGNEIIGIATHDIEHGTDGFVTTFGMVNGLNTSAYAAGDILWVSQSAGRFTNIPPTPPYDRTFVGIVTRANSNNGSVFATPLTPIHFHDISSVSASVYQQGDLWMYRSGSVGQANAWINTKQLSGSYGLTGSLTATSFTGSLQGTASTATYATEAGSANNVAGYAYATPDQINIGDLSTTNYDYIVRAQELEQSKFTTINIFNFLNF